MKQQLARALDLVENAVYLVVALLLVAMAVYTIIDAVRSFGSVSFSGGVAYSLTSILNDALFVIILMELLRTVISHLSEGGFQLRPFLIIGIISSVRRILVLGAQLSTSRHASTTSFNQALEELALDSVVAIVLTIALYIVQRLRREETARTARLHPAATTAHDEVSRELLGTDHNSENEQL
jgi:uncharacterized membrane protein (DUF373 family)